MSITLTIMFFSFILRYIRKKYPPILNVYRQKTTFSFLKYIIMFCILGFRKITSKKRLLNSSEIKASAGDMATEYPQPLHNHPLAVDAVFFNGTSRNGNAFTCGLARRPNGICNSFMYLKIKGDKFLLSPILPNTTLQQSSDEVGKFHVAGLIIDVLEPMKVWKIYYEGKMNAHQTHFEQYGKLYGDVTIDGESFNIDVDCFRDHSFGKSRDWKTFHRYVIHMIHLENGDRITVGKICIPITFSDLTMGFICENKSKNIHPVDFCDFMLYQHGENLKPPVDYAFQFQADDKMYTVQVNIIESPRFYIGSERESLIIENIAEFKVNGIKGWGNAEWQYGNYYSENTENAN